MCPKTLQSNNDIVTLALGYIQETKKIESTAVVYEEFLLPHAFLEVSTAC